MPDGLSNKVRDFREARGWTQAELAEHTGVSRKTINTVENSVFVPSVVVARRIARALGQPVEALFELAGEDRR